MSRGIVRGTDVCADCSKADPGWASVSRGVLLCDECCSVHRSLGRHISQVKSLKKSHWSTTQLAMVHQLVSLGANNIWEFLLMDPSNKQMRRKPNPRDQIHPTKADFIRAKYQFMAFVNKTRDSGGGVDSNGGTDLSQQLHSTVRTGNLELSLRLLALGANPNYFHPEKGCSPLHVATTANQPLQVELLVVYGADPGAPDVQGSTPVDIAVRDGRPDLANRLVECQHELTDRLAFYLCARKPDHKSGQHFIVPAMADSSLDLSDLAKAAKKKLQLLPNPQFEELARDVYDEVDRRETESIWIQAQTPAPVSTGQQSVPFLPVNPDFSATRNQGRQKLARFNAREFATLIIDILNDVRRRQCPQLVADGSGLSISKPLDPLKRLNVHSLPEEEPLYDSVASDEDYASIASDASIKDGHLGHGREDMGIGLPSSIDPALKTALTESQTRIRQLVQTNKDLHQEVLMLQKMIYRLVEENESLRTSSSSEISSQSVMNSYHVDDISVRSRSNASSVHSSRPVSVFEMRDSHRHQHWAKKTLQSDQETSPEKQPRLQQTCESVGEESTGSDYENTLTDKPTDELIDAPSVIAEEQLDRVSSGEVSTPTESSETLDQPPYPTQEHVVKKTEKVSEKIKLLLSCAQEQRRSMLSSCADNIYLAVNDMVKIFPQTVPDARTETILQRLSHGADRLRVRCNETSDHWTATEWQTKTQAIIQCAYNIAQACKELVMTF